MIRILSGLFLFLQFCLAYAVDQAPPAESSGSLGTIVFAVLFFGFCGGFVWMIMRNEKKPKEEPEPWKD